VVTNKNDGQKSMRNPIREAKLHIFALSKKLKEIGITDWIQGIVIFDNPRVEIEINSPSFPVLIPSQLSEYLGTYRPRKPITSETMLKIKEWLQEQQKTTVPGKWTIGDAEDSLEMEMPVETAVPDRHFQR
jgi:hypothetical protein